MKEKLRGVYMEQILQKKIELQNRIEVVLDKLKQVEDSAWFEDRNRISLILGNLLESLNHCDEKLLLKPMLESISSNLTQIESNVNTKHYNLVQSYLTEIVKTIAFLNNANGKHNLRGYQSAVNKNIKLLEKDIQESQGKLDELRSIINDDLESFEKSEKAIVETISKHKKDFEESFDVITKEMTENHQKFKTECQEELIDLKKEIADVKINFQNDANVELADFENIKTEKIEDFSNQIDSFINKTDSRIKELESSAVEKIGFVAAATHSNIYKEYSNRAHKENVVWYIATVLSMVALVGLSIWWFVFTQYNNTEFIALIARVCATVGVAVISRYCALQASKAKVVETKLRKIQLQMATFDAFVGSLEKSDQDALKIELTHKLIDQEDWLKHEKNEINIIKDFSRLLGKYNQEYKLLEVKEQPKIDFKKVGKEFTEAN